MFKIDEVCLRRNLIGVDAVVTLGFRLGHADILRAGGAHVTRGVVL